MKSFNCQNCAQLLFFENTKCEKCAHRLGYVADRAALEALDADGDGNGDVWHTVQDPARRFKFCANAALDGCNWLLPADTADALCLACRHNRTVPDLSQPEMRARWQQIEFAKHRLFYTLLKLNLPLATRAEDPAHGLAFDFLAEPADPSAPRVMTGHDDGVITLSLEEADSAEREVRRERLHEPYRTLLGHFRHEIGHYYWDLLVQNQDSLAAFRDLFGDERADYGDALKVHYDNGPPADWQTRFISAYASVHPWEDFAETWAHYFHIVDSLETASAFGMRVRAGLVQDEGLQTDTPRDFARLLDAWLPLTLAVNSLNRSLGQPDLYPFVLSQPAVRKLGFIHELIAAQRKAAAP